MKQQLDEDMYYATHGERELSDVEHAEGDVFAQVQDVIQRKTK